MSNHTFVPKKLAVLSIYELLKVEVPSIPRTEDYGFHDNKFNPTSQDMTRRLIFLLEHLTQALKNQL